MFFKEKFLVLFREHWFKVDGKNYDRHTKANSGLKVSFENSTISSIFDIGLIRQI